MHFHFFYNILPWSLYKLLRSVPKLLSFVILIAFIYGLVTALMGKAKEIPVLGSIKIKIIITKSVTPYEFKIMESRLFLYEHFLI